MKAAYMTSVLALLPMVYSLQGPLVSNSYRCDRDFYTVKNTHTYIGCLNFCWFSKRCKSVTWVKKSRSCRFHDSPSTKAMASQAMANPRCISTEVNSSSLSQSHSCRGRPCPDSHVCAPAEAASSNVCLPFDAMAPLITTTLGTTASTAMAGISVTKARGAATTKTAKTATTPSAVASTPDTSCQGAYVYVGCYLDDRDRMINDAYYRNDNMTTEWCLTQCRQGNYVFAGLQHYWQCFCGNSYDDVKYTLQSEKSCKYPCPGNSTQICGGGFRLSLYKCI